MRYNGTYMKALKYVRKFGRNQFHVFLSYGRLKSATWLVA